MSMHLIGKYNDFYNYIYKYYIYYVNIYNFLSVINIFSKYVWVVDLKDKKVIISTNSFLKFLNMCSRKPKKIGLD